MTAAVFAIPGDINLPTGGYAYDRRVLALLPSCGLAVRHLQLAASYPAPTAADLDATAAALVGVPAASVLLIDGLAYGAMPAPIIERARARIVALVHHPLCLEAGLPKPRQDELFALEKAALAKARRTITTSRITADTLVQDFAVPRERITVAEPGTERAPRAITSNTTPHLLAVGSVVPRKALDLLVRALGALEDLDWRLTIVGPTDRSAEATRDLNTAIAETGLASRITIAGALSESQLAALYATADLFVMSSLYEGYGMVLAEAMARGLPIVCTTGGAAADTVPDGAGLKVPPGDQAALANAIDKVLRDTGLRRRMADAAWSAAQSLPRWEDTAARIAAVIKEIAV
jgi:glycosyltransferase involved in cell wall biosynthesis